MTVILLVLSLAVSLDVFWLLRQPGLTLAGDADCRITEHSHDEACADPCPEPEHIHTLNCYADETADVETQLDWQTLFADYPYTGDLRTDLVGVAKTQVGYRESEANFFVNDEGVRHGYTRYGAWYGIPYSRWSAMFVSFCLHYAGADPQVYAGNTGAASMAELWKTHRVYADAGTYTPVAGDLIFFTDNTVGIVAEVQTATLSVIRGDRNQAVCNETVALSDASISGWGLTGRPLSEEPAPPKEPDLLDISNGPAVYIIEGDNPQSQSNRGPTRSVTELIPYLQANGGRYFFTLLDLNNVELPKDENGNYIAEANKGYKLTLTFNSPEGFLPGTYQYQIPNGLMVDGGEGTFILKDGTNVGTWVVTDTGLITLNFNENMNNHTDITISATLGIHFPEQEDPIDFDGMIFVKVEPPADQSDPTVLSKWGSPNAAAGKINWTTRIDGHADSQIPGNILTDQPMLSDWSRPHTYTESDMANGISFGVSDPAGGWHSWTVYADDPHLIWDENSWSYKIPKTVTCDYCGELELGNEGWVYLINYTSTPTQLNTPGTFDYENKVTIDGQTAWGWSNFTHGQVEAVVVKNGTFLSDGAGGAFLWDFHVTIPGRVEGQRAEYGWFVMDEMRLLDGNGQTVGRVQNDVNLSTVIATYNGATIQIPRIQDATDADLFAWDNSWTATENGISHTRTINLLCRCVCTPETCRWGGSCGDYWFQKDDGSWATKDFCQCWTETQNMTFTFIYRTTDMSIVEHYGSLGYQVYNQAQLYYMPDGANSIRVSWDDASVKVPNLFEKQLHHDFDGYTANYKITVNEAKLSLTDGSPLYIHDVMTKTLAYISGSLVITAEDVNGNITTLHQGADYTVTYDGTGNQKDAQGNAVHVLDIVILHPQPVMYTLDYDCTLIMPEQVTGAIKYSNSAEITLWGESIKDNAVEKVYADINISAKNYKVQMYKTSTTGLPLSGAVFGLYNEHDGLIATETTGLYGDLKFQTNITQGIILREHVLYYLQELHAPAGYRLDDTKYWFCFCDTKNDTCATCDALLADLHAVRIPLEQLEKIHVINEEMTYELPATGGMGTIPLLLGSGILVIAPLVYLFLRRRKQERRVAR